MHQVDAAWWSCKVKDFYGLVQRAREKRWVRRVEREAANTEHVVMQGSNHWFLQFLFGDTHTVTCVPSRWAIVRKNECASMLKKNTSGFCSPMCKI